MAEPNLPDDPAPAPTERPTGWFLHTRARTLGPLGVEDLRGYFNAGLVGGDATVSGPDWDGALPAAAAAARLGVTPPPAPAPGAIARPVAHDLPLRADPIWYRPAGPDWRLLALWAVVLAAVQLAIVPARSLGDEHGVGAFVVAAARNYLLVALACIVVVGLVVRALRGTWPSARGSLLAMSAVYAVLVVQTLMQPPGPEQVASTPTVAAPGAAAPPGPPRGPWDRAPVLAADDHAAVFDAPLEEPLADAEPGTDPDAPAEAVATAPVADPSARASPAPRVDPDPWQTQARDFYRASDWQRLLTHATEWSRQQPKRFEPLQFMGVAQRNLGLPGAALASFEQAIARGSRDPSTLRNLAFAYLQARDWRKAADACERILADDPDSIFALANYAHAMSQMGEYDEALDALERAAKVAPRDGRIWTALADVHRRGGFPDRARAALEKANSLR